MDQDRPTDLTAVRLTRKYAEIIDGVDLSHSQVGDRLDLPSRDARMLIAEGWALPCPSEASRDHQDAERLASEPAPLRAMPSMKQVGS